MKCCILKIHNTFSEILNGCLTWTELVREEPRTGQTEKWMDVIHCCSDKQTHTRADSWEGKSSPGMTVEKN